MCLAKDDKWDQALLYRKEAKTCTAPSQMVLKNVKDLAAQKCFSNAKQITLDTFIQLNCYTMYCMYLSSEVT